MVAKMAANGTGKAPAPRQEPEMTGMPRSGRLLAVIAALVALSYGGTLAWLALSDSRDAGEPVIRLALAEQEAPELPVEETPDPAEEVTPPVPDVDDLSAEEQALLDAARSLEMPPEESIAGEVRIVGAETVNDAAEAARATPVTLAPAPDPALVEQSKDGPLPKIARDGRKPWQVYARPVPPGTPPDRRIALVVSGMGISESATAHAIKVLPPEVTLSFAPYGARLQEWIDKAREAGHEVLLELPMEPFGYPQNDPGPHTLLTSTNTSENLSRLNWLMSRFTSYVGVMNYQGARFTASASALKPVLASLSARGLLYVDNGASARSLAPTLASDAGMPTAQATRIIDPVQNPEVIATALDTLERVSLETGSAIGIASGFPVTVDALAEWAKSLTQDGYVLVPVTAIAGE